jgi:CRISPR/Cas system CSM-associated protein Csm5 (group 7 of RAMP superfamily)
MKWTPLEDVWDDYVATVNTATEEGLLETRESAENVIYPSRLIIAETEKEEVRRYIGERMEEIIAQIQRDNAVDGNFLAAYLFRTLIAGMLWERQRIG